MKQPLPHQAKFLKWAKGRKRIGVFMRMRLGKTFSTIRWLKGELGDRKVVRVLVIAPNPVIPGWVAELEEEGQPSTVIRGTRKVRREIVDCVKHAKGMEWWLINPEGFRAMPDLAWEKWDAVIIDESTVIAHPKAKVSKLCVAHLGQVEYRAILSGLPAPESLMDYFMQMKFLHGGFLGYRNYWAFRQGCFIQAGYDWVPKRGLKEKISTELAENCYVLSEKQAGLKFKKVYESRFVELPPALRGVYRKAWKQFELGESMSKWTVEVQTWMQQLAGGIVPRDYKDGELFYSNHKLNELKYLLTGELKDRSVVVFFRFLREIKHAAKILRSAGIEVETLSGMTPRESRERAVARFQEGRSLVVLCQSRLARFGLDFSRASVVVFYSNAWEGETRDQCEARTHHPSKKEPTLYIDLVTKGTTDEAAVKALKEKIRSSKSMLKRIFLESRSA